MAMQQLPQETLSQILKEVVRLSRYEKNTVIPMRLVSKAFAAILTPYLFKTCSLDATTINQAMKGLLDVQCLRHVGGWVTCLNLNISEVRATIELNALRNTVHHWQEFEPEYAIIRKNSPPSIAEPDKVIRKFVKQMLKFTPNITRLRSQFPLEPVDFNDLHDVRCVWEPLVDGLAPLVIDTLVLDRASRRSIDAIAIAPGSNSVLKKLKRVVLALDVGTFSRGPSGRPLVHKGLGQLWWATQSLESLCVYFSRIRSRCLADGTLERVFFESIRTEPLDWSRFSDTLEMWYDTQGVGMFPQLRHLELCGIEVTAVNLVRFLKSCASTLEELYLDNILLQHEPHIDEESRVHSYWIGDNCWDTMTENCFVAYNLLRYLQPKLTVLRASRLGYRVRTLLMATSLDIEVRDESDTRTFEERFVAAATGQNHPYDHVDFRDDVSREDLHAQSLHALEPNDHTKRLSVAEYDVHVAQQTSNTPSRWRHCIDDIFANKQDHGADSKRLVAHAKAAIASWRRRLMRR